MPEQEQPEEKKYTKEPTIARMLDRALTDNEKGLLPMYIASATQQIDNYTGRSFNDIDSEDDEADPGEYVYDGNGYQELFIDDFTTIEKIEVLDSYGEVSREIEAADYIKFPSNAPYINSIELRRSRFPNGSANIRITGVSTSGTLPKPIKHVATALVVRWLTNAKIDASDLESENIEGYSYRKSKPASMSLDETDPLSQLLNSYRRINF